MPECRADEYEELARQLHVAIAEGQTVEDTAKMLRLLASEPVPATGNPEGIDVEALARAWVAALYPENEHDAGCLIDDGLGGCPVGAEIAEHAAKVAAEYARQREGERP